MMFEVYLGFAEPGNQYLGRLLAGLLPNSAEFGCIPPHFICGMENRVINEAMKLCFSSIFSSSSATTTTTNNEAEGRVTDEQQEEDRVVRSTRGDNGTTNNGNGVEGNIEEDTAEHEVPAAVNQEQVTRRDNHNENDEIRDCNNNNISTALRTPLRINVKCILLRCLALMVHHSHSILKIIENNPGHCFSMIPIFNRGVAF